MEGRSLKRNRLFSPEVIRDIHEKADSGLYSIRGFGTFRRMPNFDDMVIIPAAITRAALEGYREKCDTTTYLGTRFAKRPLKLSAPVQIAGMSFGALSAHAKQALGMAASAVGIPTCTGDGGMHPLEREYSRMLIYQCLPSRYGFNPDDVRKADAIEIVVGQGAKPGTGGLLLGFKVSETIAGMRDLPAGVDQRSPNRHPDWVGADDLPVKIEELREVTDWQVPIFVKMGACRVWDDVKMAAKAGADVIVIDGLEGGTAASPEILQDHTGMPTLAAVVEAADALRSLGLQEDVQLVISGGIKNGVDAIKALALGATCVSIGTAALVALGCNRPEHVEDYHKLGVEPGTCYHCHTGLCPVGIATQDRDLMARLNVDLAAERVEHFLHAFVYEMQILARACGKSDVHDMDPTDLRALTLEASMITGVPLVGTRQAFGHAPAPGH